MAAARAREPLGSIRTGRDEHFWNESFRASWV